MKKRPHHLYVSLVAAALVAFTAAPAGAEGHRKQRDRASKHYSDGNYKDAYELYRKLALNQDNDPALVGNDLVMGVNCLRSLYRVDETDGFREDVIGLHADNWRLLYAAANSYNGAYHYGTIIAGEFHRGDQRGGGRYVNTMERDRVRALQLMNQAFGLIEDGKTSGGGLLQAVTGGKGQELSQFCQQFARILLGYRGYNESWRLQYMTDLSQLPDYEDGYGYYYGGGTRGAPVDKEGNPVFHKLPENWSAALTDGERWRWLHKRAMQFDPASEMGLLREYAGFLYQQFGVQTLAWYGRSFVGQVGEGESDDSGIFSLHTLGENETVARLATGMKRFDLPEDANYIEIYRKTGDLATLAQIFENRRQYTKAAKLWKQAGYQDRYQQIVGNWGQFEPLSVLPAQSKATMEYRFRNGNKVSFDAREVDVGKLLSDVRKYLKSNPRELDWDRMNISNIGYRLVHNDRKKYVGKKAASWSMDLEPRERHFDKLVTVKTPLEKAGVYLVTAKMADGNVSNILIWMDDTVIVKKQLDGKAWFYVGDAVTGKPLGRTKVKFFGYRQEYIGAKWPGGRQYKVYTKRFTRTTDHNGQLTVGPKEYDNRYQWIISVTTDGGRLAYLGFTSIWYGNYHDYEYNQTKVFTITDRPVYRPNQPVRFKTWVRHAKYDQEDKSTFAGTSFTARITNPKGEKVLEKTIEADAYGGIEGEYLLPDDAPLGVYYIQLVGYGGSNFRVEEYKKPEFEVKVEAPREPVMLGEKIDARVEAKYYFGAPVTEAKVKYKVLRSNYRSNWYPWGYWDWFYGPGYWWFHYDYSWWPNWGMWGCRRPLWWWWGTSHAPPEVVAEGEAEIGKDGTFSIKIDTAIAKELHGNTDHRYEITAEVTDKSRRTIVGTGAVLVARRPFKVYAWVDRGHYRVGDVVHADFLAQTLDNRGVKGSGELSLFSVTYDDEMKPVEKAVQQWSLATDDAGRAEMQLKASKAGQYRLSYKVTDARNHVIEGGYVFVVRGEGFDGKNFRFNEIELVPDKKEYSNGDTVKLMVNIDRPGATVMLFVRPANGVYLVPEVLHLEGKSTVHEIKVTKKDMPNFFVEAFTVYNGKLYSDTREIIVPPEKRVINVEVVPDETKYKPGQKAKLKLKLTDYFGKPIVGSLVMSVYDKSVEYISGGSNVPEIRSFFWKWRRSHYPAVEHTLTRQFWNVVKPGTITMQFLGAFGHMVQPTNAGSWGDDDGVEMALDSAPVTTSRSSRGSGGGVGGFALGKKMKAQSAPAAPGRSRNGGDMEKPAERRYDFDESTVAGELQKPVQPTVRKKFADTAFWVATLEADKEGRAEVEFEMPENLTGWRIRTWAMGHGTKVGESTVEVVTVKNLLLRLQAPRFFVEKDEVVLSANIHNYLDNAKNVQAVLELDGENLEALSDTRVTVEIKAGGEARVDWRVKVVSEGEAVVRMKALSDEESDAMEMRFPVYVHGMLKTESYCGVVRPEGDKATILIDVPEERRVEQSRLELRYSPTLAGAMVDALPYLVEYPYGCTEQTLNRFLPTVTTRKVLKDMGIDLKAVQDKRTNLNAQEIGDDNQRAKQWQRWDRNPVFDEKVVDDMVRKGLWRLQNMQLSDGGWGWFSGWGEYSYPHTTAYVVHGLQTAKANGVKVNDQVLSRGVAWLLSHQNKQLRLLKRGRKKDPKHPYKLHADNLDAFIYMVLEDAGQQNKEMRKFLYEDRNHLAVYGKAMFAVALHKQGHKKEVAMIMRNIEQYLIEDEENQTAYLKLPNSNYWWYWYGSEYEAHAYYLKLLSLTDPKSHKAAGLVKYLLNNRKHATYWNSTRDTALCVEAFADYLRGSGEDKPDMTVEIFVDGDKVKSERITADNLFTFDNKLVLEAGAVTTGKHKVEIRRKGTGPVYFNAYLTNFTLEDFITKAGLEIKVQRKYYKLRKVDKTVKVAGARGQALDQKVEKYERELMGNLDLLKSGDLVEIEMEIESKNDYEYIIFEDMKAAGFEPMDVRSGYSDNKGMPAYREFRDEKVCFFVRALARGKHSMAYRMRAEIPGKFSALPTRAFAMYAPELKANSDEIKIRIED